MIQSAEVRKVGTIGQFLFWTVIFGLTAACIAYGLFSVGTPYVKGSALTDQSLAGYIALVIGAAVAFAGSLVAIRLAGRALDSSLLQVELTNVANSIAERQTPEAQLAADAASHYERLKGMLITMPSLMRRAQRDGCFGPGANRALLQDLIRVIAGPARTLLDSSVPATIINLSRTLDERFDRELVSVRMRGVQRQRYFEYALSSISYDLVHVAHQLELPPGPGNDGEALQMHLQRLLHALFSTVRELDRLIGAAAREIDAEPAVGIQPNAEAVAALGETRLTGQFSTFDVSFISKVMPVVKLNPDLWLKDDFAKLAKATVRKLALTLPERIVTSLEETGAAAVDTGGLILALHDSGHAQAMQAIENAVASGHQRPVVVRLDDGGWTECADRVNEHNVPLFWITEQAGERLIQLETYLAANVERWPRRIVIVDQVELAEDTPNTSSKKYLTLFERLACWRAFVLLRDLCDDATGTKAHALDNVQMTDRRVQDALMRARGRYSDGLRADDLTLPVGQHLTDSMGPMFEAAAVAAEADRGDVEGMGVSWTLACNAALELIQSASASARDDAIDGPAPDEPTVGLADPIDFSSARYPAFKAALDELARVPLLDAPLYAFASVNAQSLREFSLPRTAIFGVAYIDSAFGIGSRPSELFRMLAAPGRPVYRLF